MIDQSRNVMGGGGFGNSGIAGVVERALSKPQSKAQTDSHSQVSNESTSSATGMARMLQQTSQQAQTNAGAGAAGQSMVQTAGDWISDMFWNSLAQAGVYTKPAEEQ